jgi:hypothetical protein
MFIDEAMSTGTTTHFRVVLEEGEVAEPHEVGAFVLSTMWGGDGDYSEVIDQGDGVFEVLCS